MCDHSCERGASTVCWRQHGYILTERRALLHFENAWQDYVAEDKSGQSFWRIIDRHWQAHCYRQVVVALLFKKFRTRATIEGECESGCWGVWWWAQRRSRFRGLRFCCAIYQLGRGRYSDSCICTRTEDRKQQIWQKHNNTGCGSHCKHRCASLWLWMINKTAGIDVYSEVMEIEPVRSCMQIVRNSKIKRRVKKTNETEEIQEREPPVKKNKPDTATPATNKKTLALKAAQKGRHPHL